MFSRKFTIILLVFLAAASFMYADFAFAQSVDFYVDGSFDKDGKGNRTAILRYEGVSGKFFLEENYWTSLNSSQQTNLLADVKKLSDEFDNTIYSGIRAVFGQENNPGVDNDPKVTILLTPMTDEVGGYFKEQDGVLRIQVQDSNEREMVYLNIIHSSNPRTKAFLAHEFQHLITFNQKYIRHKVQEEVWINELRSEISPTLLGYDSSPNFNNSNLQARLAKFLKNPSDAILNWNSEDRDYASINLFGQYVLDHYGRSVFAAMSQNEFKGIESFNAALNAFSFKEKFSDVYINWAIANLVNNCSMQPIDAFCYKNPLLSYGALHINFDYTGASGGSITSESETESWKSGWFEYTTALKPQRPDDNIFKLDFDAPSESKFRVPYVIYDKDSVTVKDIEELMLDVNGNGTFYVPDFGFTIPRIVIIPSNQAQNEGVAGRGSVTSYKVSASTVTFIPSISSENSMSTISARESETVLLPDFPDGTLIRASNDYKVYIIRGGYKRWIQSAEIFGFYGHLNFESVKVVSPETLALYKDSWLVRADGDIKVYEINGDGTRHWLDISAEEFSISGRQWDMVYVINNQELNWYTEGPAVK